MDEVRIEGKEMEKSGYRQLFGSGCKEEEGQLFGGHAASGGLLGVFTFRHVKA